MYEYVKQFYGVSPVPGKWVTTWDGAKRGRISRERPSHQHYVYVRFEGNRHAVPCHPTDLVYE